MFDDSMLLAQTYMGSILVSVNPYKLLPIYSNEIVRRYIGKRIGLEPPHIFAVGDAAYKQMQDNGGNQSLIIRSAARLLWVLADMIFCSRTAERAALAKQVLYCSPHLHDVLA
jgi:hypothetical protein